MNVQYTCNEINLNNYEKWLPMYTYYNTTDSRFGNHGIFLSSNFTIYVISLFLFGSFRVKTTKFQKIGPGHLLDLGEIHM